MYANMHFGLINAGATFQRAMYIDFSEDKDKFVVIYMDDITLFSKFNRNHAKHLEKVFLKCRRYGISLDPRKSIFSLKEGKILGCIISKEGIKINLYRVNAILKVE